MKTMEAIFMGGTDKQYQMPQKTSKENSKAICLVQEQKLLTTVNIWLSGCISGQREKLEEAILKQIPSPDDQYSFTEAKVCHRNLSF